jgi:molecular chaperone GrpE
MGCAEPAESAQPAESDETGTAVVLGEIAGRLGELEEQVAEFHRRSVHRESVIDRLHEENQQLRSGAARILLEPVIADLIRLHDQLGGEACRLMEADGDGRLLWSFAEDVAQILDRCGIDMFSAQPGDAFERGRHRALAIVPCDDSARHNTVAKAAAAGFIERATERVRRPAHVHVFQYTGESV